VVWVSHRQHRINAGTHRRKALKGEGLRFRQREEKSMLKRFSTTLRSGRLVLALMGALILPVDGKAFVSGGAQGELGLTTPTIGEASGGQQQRSTPDLPVSEELTDEDEDLLGLQGGQDPVTSFRRIPGERAGPPYLRR
jgi:hypothetical protein